MKSNNKIYSIVFLAVISLFLLSMFSQKKVAQPQSENNISQVTDSDDKKTADSNTFFTKYKQQKKTITAVSQNTSNQPAQIEKYKAYLSAQAIGIIGMYNEYKSDNPADNIFTITLDRDITANNKVELSYTLTGVEDLSNVTYSINDRPALGGYLIKKAGVSSKQKVEIDPSWLKKGENRIQFSVPEDAAYGYKIENLTLEVENADQMPFAVNTGNSLYGNQAYIQGFVKGESGIVSLNGKAVPVKDGVFETIVNNIQNNEVTLTATVGGKTYTKHIFYKNETTPDVEYAFIRSFDKTYKTFEKGKADTLQIANAELNVSDTSLLANKSLSVMNLRDVDVPAMDYGMINVTGESNGLRFLPHGEHFKQGTTVSIKYDRTKIPSGYTEDDVKTYYFDNATKHWVALERDSVDKTLCMVVSKTTHFTDMINGVIKTPESPETAGFTPTMMNDIKAADPTAGIQMIAPPTANNSGSANLSYKIELPPARNGMAPDLTIQYNSDGGSGWLGEGWDLNIPDIKIDTKFGVPTYNTQFETETYLLNGMMLARAFVGKDASNNQYDDEPEKMFLPDRGVVHTRNLGNDTIYQFYQRVESNFNLITRYGTKTSDYKWMVEDKGGTKYYYGYNGAVLGKDTIVNGKNALCKLAEWKLQSMVDIHKDSVAYIYNIDKDNEEGYIGNSVTLKPKAIYLAKIECYTYIESTKNYIKNSDITFVSNSKKTKKTNNARYGFLVSNQRLLDSVVVKYRNSNNILEKVRTYAFKYKIGPLYSDLLQGIIQLDSAGNQVVAASQVFDYYNDIPKVNNAQSYINQSNTNAITNPDESIFTKYAGLINKVPSKLVSDNYKMVDKNGLINNNTTTAIGGGIYIGFGTGFKVFTKENTIGVNADYKFSRTKGQSMMIDINGDGLVDNVFKEDGKLYFCPRKSNNEFGTKQELIGAPTDFLKTDNNVFSMGLQANGKITKDVSGYAKLDYDFYNKTITFNYFSDVNNDGLMDIIASGHVYFNYLVNGIPHFSENSKLSANPMTNKTIYDLNRSLTGLLRYNPAPDDTTKSKACPLQDLVRVWEAPYKGVVNISGDIKLLMPVGDYDTLQYKKADGVRVAIQKNKNELWAQKIERDNHLVILSNVSTLVNKGEKIYFRLQSGDSLLSDGNFDAVIWNPIVQYTSTEQAISEVIDVNGYSNLKYIASEGNVINKISYNEIDTGVAINIKGYFCKPITKGDVKLQIFSSNYPSAYIDSLDSHDNPICHSDYQYLPIGEVTYSAGRAYNQAPITFGDSWWSDLLARYKLLGNRHKYFWFKLTSDVPIRWDSVKCYPSIEYRYLNQDSVLIKDTLYAGVKYDINRKQLVYKPNNNYPPIPKTCDIGHALIKPMILSGGNCMPISGEILIKTSDGFSYQRRFENLGESLDFYTGTIRSGCTFTFYLDNDEYKGHSLGVAVTDKDSPYSTQYVLASDVYALKEDVDFGAMWRNWGQFEYNAAQGRYKKPIEEDSLFLPPDTANILFDDMLFVTLAPNIKTKKTWQGYSDNIQLMGDTMITGRLMDTEVDIAKFISPSSGIRAPQMRVTAPTIISEEDKKYVITAKDIISKQTNLSTSLGINVSVINKIIPQKVRNKLKNLKLNLDTLSAGVNVDFGWGSSETLQDYKDFNGDGYPDYYVDKKIQYSNSRGTITDVKSEEIINEKSNSNVQGIGISLGSSSPLIKKSATESATQKSSELAVTIGANASISQTNSQSNITYQDINGDGLPDMLKSDGTVCINYGYIFSQPVTLNNSCSSESSTLAKNAGLGFGIEKGKGSWQAGVGIANALSTTKRKLVDVNGDGLLDIVSLKENFIPSIDGYFKTIPRTDIYVKLNLGNKFGNDSLWCSSAALENNISTSYSANAAFTFGFTWGVRIVINPSVNASLSYSRNLDDILDYDGDGYADVLTTDLIPTNANDAASLKVRYSNIRRTNKLKSVTNSLGGSFTMDYEHSAASSDHPGGKWVMKSVEINDGLADDGPVMKNLFEYKNGKYNRREREFNGFGEVTTRNIDTEKSDYATNPVAVRTVTQVYDVSNYYVKGNLLQEAVKDNSGNIFSRSENKYYAYNVRTKRVKKNYDSKTALPFDSYYYDDITGKTPADTMVVYAPVKYSQSKIFEGNADSLVTSQIFYKYWVDNNVNKKEYAVGEDVPYNFGDLKIYRFSDKGKLSQDGGGGYNYETSINYKHEMLGKYYVAGIPTEVLVKSSSGQQFRHVKAYYTHKNFPTHLTRVTQFLNSAATDSASTKIAYDYAGNIIYKLLPSKMAYQYTYDTKYNMYLTQVKDTFGYSSSLANYNYKYGVPCTTTDINGNVMTTKIDQLGRVISIRGTNETVNNKPYTIAFEYNPKPVINSGKIFTPAYAVTKHYDVQNSDDPIETVTFVDGFGRAVQVKKEGFVEGTNQFIVSGRAKFDALGRVKEAYYPLTCSKSDELKFITGFASDAAPTKTVYDALDRPLTVTLPDGSVTTTKYSIATLYGVEHKTLVTDALGNKQATFTDGSGQTTRTVQYVSNNNTISTKFEYDDINQLVKITDAKGKETLSEYDMAGRRTQVTHPASGVTKFAYDAAGNLKWKYTANKDTIKYAYDFNRLKSVTYPRHPENNVKYTYGDKNAAKNLKARLILQEDGSGAQEFKYGNMSELTEVRRTLVIPNQAVATYVTKWNYDSWNRVQRMIYPDGETVKYLYDLGGNLTTVQDSTHNKFYVTNIVYDKFEQRKSITYGNNVTTNYEYENATRRLQTMKVQSGANAIMNNTYTYDKVGNVTQLVNTGTATNNIGGSITHNYGYDNLYRLTSANGTFTGANGKAANYTLTMEYDNLHNIISKKQEITQTNLQFTGTLKAGYNLAYTYNQDNAQQISSIADENYRTETADMPKENDVHTYKYDANGNLKNVFTGTLINDTVLNAVNERKLLWDEENRLTALSDNGYVSNYIYDAAGERTVKMHGGSEGVMVNGKQAAARLGAVDFTAYVSPYLVVSPGGNYTKHIYAGSQRIASELANGMINVTNEVKAGGSNGIYDTKINLIQAALKTEYDSLGVKYGKINSTFTGSGTNTGNLLYFYHPDHLGSSSLITDVSGNVTQHIEYVPYGEVFIEEKNATWRTPYKFNAKELDEETGLYYYGARYYDPKTSVWISSDPLRELYPNASSYLYCNANPVRYIDPTGMDWYEHKNDNGKSSYIWQEGNKSTITINDQEYNNVGQYHTSTTSDGSVSIYYNQNNIVSVVDKDDKSLFSSSSLTIASAATSYAQVTQYSKTLGIWRGSNGIIYRGLKGRGPNGATGARALAKSKAAKIGIASDILTGLGMYLTYKEYKFNMSNNPGPNLKHYLKMRYNRDQAFNGSGFLGLYGACASFGYNLGYLIEDVTGTNIQLNPFTNDFTPIEQTLTDFDNAGIYVYGDE